jgi:hypothetical protein
MNKLLVLLRFTVKILAFDFTKTVLTSPKYRHQSIAKFSYFFLLTLIAIGYWSQRAGANPTAATIRSSLKPMTINKMARFDRDLNTKIPAQAQAVLGGLTEINCSKGQSPAACLPLGALDTSFKLGQMTPGYMATKTGKPLTGKESLASTVPFLGKMSARDAIAADPSLARLLPRSGITFTRGGGQVINPADLNRPFGSLVDLNKVPINTTNLANTPLNRFPGYQKLTPNQIPNLGNVSFLDLPGVAVPAGVAIVKADAIRTKERNIHHMVMSGSEQEKNAKCNQNCDYLEVLPVVGLPYLKGGKIISGDSLQVRGGEGLLAWVNGGKEPTGVHFMGFKWVLRHLNPRTGTATVNLNLRFCYNILWTRHCTPYFIGIPLWQLSEKHNSFPLMTTDASVYRVFKLKR